ncbi:MULTISPECIES: hypothetical protein [Streptomyces]|uniref:hypothetical protein n=1 Tax=Streptomyces TaxID=1883 RepID=UPI001671BC26|nr:MULTISPECIES: hypothetical protein [Streptomyces]MBK3524851.1 hypothetical protein [Streptomyces sp. MBT70]GGR70927.1 hypothetical protein GCM10010236_26480 [Streptomyces eurythermus]
MPATDQRTRTHITALADEMKRHLGEPAAAPAQVFLSGMLTGLASAIEILDGGTAERAAGTVEQRLAAAVGRAYIDGKLGEQPAPVDWEAIAQQRERELRDVGEARYIAEQERDGAYRERAHLVALLAALTNGAVITDAPDVDEPGWQIVYLTIGGRQCSWHIAPRDADLVTHVERVDALDVRALWDGHTTEEKYTHIAEHTAELSKES